MSEMSAKVRLQGRNRDRCRIPTKNESKSEKTQTGYLQSVQRRKTETQGKKEQKKNEITRTGE